MTISMDLFEPTELVYQAPRPKVEFPYFLLSFWPPSRHSPP